MKKGQHWQRWCIHTVKHINWGPKSMDCLWTAQHAWLEIINICAKIKYCEEVAYPDKMSLCTGRQDASVSWDILLSISNTRTHLSKRNTISIPDVNACSPHPCTPKTTFNSCSMYSPRIHKTSQKSHPVRILSSKWNLCIPHLRPCQDCQHTKSGCHLLRCSEKQDNPH